MARTDLTAQQVRDLFSYDPATGLFTWLAGSRIGRKAGSLHTRGYITLYVCGRAYKAHRIAWLHHYGCHPRHQVDHINSDRADNRIANLRDVTPQVNSQNRRVRNTGDRSLPLGVTRDPRGRLSKPFVSRINVGPKKILLGQYASADEAHSAYVEAKRRLHDGCTI